MLYICIKFIMETSIKKVNVVIDDLSSTITFTESIKDDFILFKKIVGIFSAAFVDDIFHLTKREMELLHCVFMCIASGDREVYSATNMRKYFKSFKDKKTVQVWIPKLIEKGWVYFSGDLCYINGNFDRFKKTKKINFNITLDNEVG